MKNSNFNCHDVKTCCENKLNIDFRGGGELNGWFILNGKKVARITVPKGRKFIPPGTYKTMAKQLKLNIAEFDDLLECPLKKEKYEEILRSKITDFLAS